MLEKLLESRDIVAELLSENDNRPLARLGRIIEELTEEVLSWDSWHPDDRVVLAERAYPLPDFDDLPF